MFNPNPLTQSLFNYCAAPREVEMYWSAMDKGPLAPSLKGLKLSGKEKGIIFAEKEELRYADMHRVLEVEGFYLFGSRVSDRFGARAKRLLPAVLLPAIGSDADIGIIVYKEIPKSVLVFDNETHLFDLYEKSWKAESVHFTLVNEAGLDRPQYKDDLEKTIKSIKSGVKIEIY